MVLVAGGGATGRCCMFSIDCKLFVMRVVFLSFFDFLKERKGFLVFL